MLENVTVLCTMAASRYRESISNKTKSMFRVPTKKTQSTFFFLIMAVSLKSLMVQIKKTSPCLIHQSERTTVAESNEDMNI